MALRMTKKDQTVTETRWVDYDAETKVQLARIDNPAYTVALERERRKLRNADAQFAIGAVGVIDGETTEHKTQCKLLSQFVVKDWEGVQDENGNPLKYSAEAAEHLLDTHLEFFMFTLREASNTTIEALKAMAETVGKPSPASNGSESGADKPTSAD